MIPFKGPESLGPPRLLSRRDLIQVILRLQVDGWRNALQTNTALTSDRDEPYMNGCLYQGMVRIRNALGLTNIFLVEGPGVRAETDSVLPQGEPDIIMLFSEFGANDPHAVIECKRVDPYENPKRLRGEYVRAGIDRFIGGLYGHGHDTDFLVGYVLRGSGSDAMADLNAYLQNVKRSQDRLQPAAEFQEYGFIARSDHIRTDHGERLSLLHNFVSF